MSVAGGSSGGVVGRSHPNLGTPSLWARQILNPVPNGTPRRSLAPARRAYIHQGQQVAKRAAADTASGRRMRGPDLDITCYRPPPHQIATPLNPEAAPVVRIPSAHSACRLPLRPGLPHHLLPGRDQRPHAPHRSFRTGLARDWGCTKPQVENRASFLADSLEYGLYYIPEVGWDACELLARDGMWDDIKRSDSVAVWHYYVAGRDRTVTLRGDEYGRWTVDEVDWGEGRGPNRRR